jgi:GTPase SAR1 family protein
MILQSKYNNLVITLGKWERYHYPYHFIWIRRESFAAVQGWLTQIRTLAHPKIVTILVGNKCDMKAERQVETREGEGFAIEHDLLFTEVSAFSGDNISDAFERCAGSILTKMEMEHHDLDHQDNMRSVIQVVGTRVTAPTQPKTFATSPGSSSCC